VTRRGEPGTDPVAASDPTYEAGSFRDRRARVFYDGDDVLRALDARAAHDWREFSRTPLCRQLTEERALVATDEVPARAWPASPPSTEWAAILRHARIPFISYPFEWPFGMLRDAALLHLDIMRRALASRFVLKDATPYNYQWVGARPQLIDVSSIVPLVPGEPWIAYRQFCRMFLNPLLLEAYGGMPFQPWLRGSLDGMDAETCWRALPAGSILRRGVLRDVYLQARFERAYGGSSADLRTDLRDAGFTTGMLDANLDRLTRIIGRLRSPRTRSTWADYATTHGYDGADEAAKEGFVRRACSSRRWRLAWDLGANTGHYSRIAAESAEYVLALDADAVSVERLYASLRTDGHSRVLPLVFDIADPSPGLGWRGRERRSLPDRGKPDLILCLALLHHLVISAGVPMAEVVDWLTSLGASLIVEFVDREDPMVQRLLRQKHEPYADYDRSHFERQLSSAFTVTARHQLGSGTRVLYAAERRA
jgi:hypothetical protein